MRRRAVLQVFAFARAHFGKTTKKGAAPLSTTDKRERGKAQREAPLSPRTKPFFAHSTLWSGKTGT